VAQIILTTDLYKANPNSKIHKILQQSENKRFLVHTMYLFVEPIHYKIWRYYNRILSYCSIHRPKRNHTAAEILHIVYFHVQRRSRLQSAK